MPTVAAAEAVRPLRVAVALPAPGFWDGTTARAGGFEADLARELATRLGRGGVTVVDTPFPRIVRGRFAADLALSEVSITPERERVVDFSVPYLFVDQAVVMGATAALGDWHLPDLRWGVVRATTGADTLRSIVRPVVGATEFATESEAFAALGAGRVDAVMIDGPIAARAVAASGGALAISLFVPTGERYGVVLPKGSRLRRPVSVALAAMVGDGTVARLAAAAGLPTRVPEPDFIT